MNTDATLVGVVTSTALGLRLLAALIVAGVIAATAGKIRPVAAAVLCGAVLLEASEMVAWRVIWSVLLLPWMRGSSAGRAEAALAGMQLLSMLVSLAVGGLVVFGLMKLAEPRRHA